MVTLLPAFSETMTEAGMTTGNVKIPAPGFRGEVAQVLWKLMGLID